MKLYRSPYEAYPFLHESLSDLRCDFELATDGLANKIGMLRALCQEANLIADLETVGELVYHANPSLRMGVKILPTENEWLKERVLELEELTKGRCHQYVLPQGKERGAWAHILRSESKDVVRLLYGHVHNGKTVEPLLFDFFNLLSGYFFFLAMHLNQLDQVEEIPFKSRHYK